MEGREGGEKGGEEEGRGLEGRGTLTRVDGYWLDSRRGAVSHVGIQGVRMQYSGPSSTWAPSCETGWRMEGEGLRISLPPSPITPSHLRQLGANGNHSLRLLHPPAGNCVRREGEERGERGEEKSGVG